MATIRLNKNVDIKEDVKYILNTLKNKLSDEYYVYYKPFLNGEMPDIVVLKKGGGLYIINLSYVNIEEISNVNFDEKVINLKDGKRMKLPMDKVNEQKCNMYSYHISSLLRAKINNMANFSLVSTGILFTKATQSKIQKFFKPTKYILIFGMDKLDDLIKNIKDRFEYCGKYFTNEIFEEARQKLEGKFLKFKDEEEERFILSSRQTELAKSKSGRFKIKGFAGSGKTLILANRVINHIKRMREEGKLRPKVLIFTFNITLRKYISKHISRLIDEESLNNIEINHYHKFIFNKANQYNIPKSDFRNEKAFSDINIREEEKYDGIFIDEIQDYEIEWQNIIANNFLASNGEYVVFGDEKQNIYSRKLESDNTVKTNIKGRWNTILENHRAMGKLVYIALQFQEKFLRSKYSIDSFDTVQEDFFGLNQLIEYIPCQNIYNISFKISEILSNPNININKSIILSDKIEMLRDVEYKLRDNKLRHILTFETSEEYGKIIQTSMNVEESLYEVRRSKKYNFDDGKGLKFSTIHSFKGWQEDTVILVITDNERGNNSELIYTALTRCRKNLIILDTSSQKTYEKFFENCI
ncbi:MAG: PIF1 family ATP-dependent DNA helicase [Clostridium sp.]|nr:PIF1 family ATP-dependent DNA helicase [Clostridium sp.]